MQPPDYITKAASRGLELLADGFGGDGLTEKTISAARAMAAGEISDEKIVSANAWAARHAVDLEASKNRDSTDPEWPGAGAVAHFLWGIDPLDPAPARAWLASHADMIQNPKTMTDLFIYGDIGQPSADKPRISAAAFLAQLNTIAPGERINVRIHSNGGSVSEAAAIYNAIAAHPGGADTQIDGIAASAAAYIAMAGQKIRMAGNAMLMIHNVSAIAEGNAEEMRRMAIVVDQFSATIVPAFAARSGMTKEQIVKMMSTDTYFTATQAKALGFIDEITGDLNLAASLTLPVHGSVDKAPRAMSEPLTISAEDKSFITNLREFFTGKHAAPDPMAALQSELSNVRSEVTATKNALLEVTNSRDAALAELAEIRNKIETPEATEAKVSALVNARLAAAGINPIQRDPNAAPTSGREISAQLAAITDPGQRSIFVKAHRAEIYAAANAEKIN